MDGPERMPPLDGIDAAAAGFEFAARTLGRLARALALLPLLFAATASAQTAALVPADVEWALAYPRAHEGAAAAHALIEATRSPLARNLRDAWAAQFPIDPFDPVALRAAGIPRNQGVALYARRGAAILSLPVEDRATLESAVRRWLAGIGKVEERKGALVALRADRPEAAIRFTQGRVLIARVAERGADPLAALAATTRSLAADGNASAIFDGPGAPLRIWVEEGGMRLALSVTLAGETLVASGRLQAGRLRDFLAASPAPTSAEKGGLLLLRAHFAKRSFEGDGSVSTSLRWLVARACASCTPGEIQKEADALGALLQGPAWLLVDRLEPAQLRSGDPAELPFAWAARVRDPAAAERYLRAFAKRTGAAEASGGHVVGRFHFGLRGSQAWVSTDPSLVPRLLDGAKEGSGAPLQLRFTPSSLASTLERLGLQDALAGGPLASLFAARLEVGALLRNAGALHLSARSEGSETLVIEASWPLRVAAPPAR